MLTHETARSENGVEEVTEEHDSDSKAGSAPAATSGPAFGLRSFLPSFSNSKYARARRQNSVYLPPGVRDPGRLIKDSGKVQVEPKVWLANESKLV